MAKNNFFFKRDEFSPPEIKQPYYTYLGYFLAKSKGNPTQKRNPNLNPISIYFGRDEIAVYFTNDDEKVFKIFSLYVAEGSINQNMLSKKIEDYSLMPLWPLSDELLQDELKRLYVDPVLLDMGFFGSYYGFELKGDMFSKSAHPSIRSGIVQIKEGGSLEFTYKRDFERLGDPPKDTWTLKEGQIHAKKINFSKILLDFLFELEFANTFEDANFLRLQPHLQNNKVLDALTKKCQYLSALRRQQTFSQETRKPNLPKPFQDAEKEWLNVCRLEEYKPVFTSPHSLFDEPEDEVKRVVFKARIGEGRRPRKAFLKRKEDAQLKNELCTFFMRKYDIWNAFRVLMPTGMVFLVPLILLAIPLGDYFLGKGKATEGLVGICSIALPIAILFFIFLCQIFRGINLFKLLLPRLFLGILLGWSIFWSTEELWKRSLTAHSSTVLIFDLFLLVIIFMYIFTDISNRMYRKADLRVVRKTFTLVGMALVLSFVIGFYVIQFFGKPMIENSGFLENKMLYNVQPFHGSGQPSLDDEGFPASLDEFFDEQRHSWFYWHSHFWDLMDHVEYIYGTDDHLETDAAGRTSSDMSMKNFSKYPVSFFSGEAHIRYIWSILFSQFIISILIGIVLQLLWEDRPITEPL